MFELELDLDHIGQEIETMEKKEAVAAKDVEFYGTRSELREYLKENYGFIFNEAINYNPNKKEGKPSYDELELTFGMCPNDTIEEYVSKKLKSKLGSQFVWKHPVFGRDKNGNKKIIGYNTINAPYTPVRVV